MTTDLISLQRSHQDTHLDIKLASYLWNDFHFAGGLGKESDLKIDAAKVLKVLSKVFLSVFFFNSKRSISKLHQMKPSTLGKTGATVI